MEGILPSIPNSEQKQLLGIGELLRQTWVVFRSHFVLFLGVSIPPLVGIWFSLYFPYSSWSWAAQVLLSLWMGISLIYAAKERDKGISIIQALQKGTRGFVFFTWIVLLTLFIGGGGFFLLIIPGVILWIWFAFGGYVLVDEGIKGMSALLRSKDIVSGYTWQVFLRFLVLWALWLIVYIPLWVLLDAFGLAPPLFTFEAEVVQESSFLGTIILDIPAHIWAIFYPIFGLLLYENIKQVKGNPSFEIPSRGRKLKYLAFGLVWPLLPIAFIVALFTWALVMGSIEARY